MAAVFCAPFLSRLLCVSTPTAKYFLSLESLPRFKGILSPDYVYQPCAWKVFYADLVALDICNILSLIGRPCKNGMQI